MELPKPPAVTFPALRNANLDDHTWLPKHQDELRAAWGYQSPYKQIEKLCQNGGVGYPRTHWIDLKKVRPKEVPERNYEIELNRPDMPSTTLTVRIKVDGRPAELLCVYLLALADLLYAPYPAPKHYTMLTLLREAEIMIALPGPQMARLLGTVRSISNQPEITMEQYATSREDLFSKLATAISLPDPYSHSPGPATNNTVEDPPKPSIQPTTAQTLQSTTSSATSTADTPSIAATSTSASESTNQVAQVESLPTDENAHITSATSHADIQTQINGDDANHGTIPYAVLGQSSEMDVDPSPSISQLPTPLSTSPPPLDSRNLDASREIRRDEPVELNLPSWTSLLTPVEIYAPQDPSMQLYFNYDWDDIIPCEVKLWTEWREKWTKDGVGKEDITNRSIDLLKRLHTDGSFVRNEKETILWSEELYVLWVLFKGTVTSTLRDMLYDDQEVCGLEVLRLRILYSCNKYILPKFLHMLLQTIATCPNAIQAARDLLDVKLLAHLTTVAEWAVTAIGKFEALEIMMYLCRLVDFALLVIPPTDLSSYKTYRLVSACKVLNSGLKGEKMPWLKAAILRLSARAAVPGPAKK